MPREAENKQWKGDFELRLLYKFIYYYRCWIYSPQITVTDEDHIKFPLLVTLSNSKNP